MITRLMGDLIEGAINNLSDEDIDEWLKIGKKLQRYFKIKNFDDIAMGPSDYAPSDASHTLKFDEVVTDMGAHIPFAYEKLDGFGTMLYFANDQDADDWEEAMIAKENEDIDESLTEDNSNLFNNRTLLEVRFDVAESENAKGIQALKGAIEKAVSDAGYAIEGKILIDKNDYRIFKLESLEASDKLIAVDSKQKAYHQFLRGEKKIDAFKKEAEKAECDNKECCKESLKESDGWDADTEEADRDNRYISFEDDDYSPMNDDRPEWEKDIEWADIYGGDSSYCRKCHGKLEYDNDGDLACPECQPSRFEREEDETVPTDWNDDLPDDFDFDDYWGNYPNDPLYDPYDTSRDDGYGFEDDYVEESLGNFCAANIPIEPVKKDDSNMQEATNEVDMNAYGDPEDDEF